MPRVVWLEQGDATFNLLLWNLTKNILREVVLKFAERRHAIVDTIEQQENGNAGHSAAGEAYKKSLQ